MKRDNALDIAKGITIILMIIGHCKAIPYMPVRHLIFTYHMPFFFIASGFCFKPQGVKYSLINDIKHLMIPYAVTCCAILLFYSLSWAKTGSCLLLKSYFIASLWGSGTNHSCLLFSNHPVIGAIWFLPALLVCKNTYNTIKQKCTHILVISTLIFFVASILGRYVIFVPFSVLSGLSAIIFFAIGDYLKNIRTIKWYWFVIGIICWLLSYRFSHIYIVQPQYDLYLIDVLGATTASILVYLFSKLLSQAKVAHPLSWVGRNTLIILCIHLIDLDCDISTRMNVFESDIATIILRVFVPIAGVFIYNTVKKKILTCLNPEATH